MIDGLLGQSLYERAIDVIITRYYHPLLHFNKYYFRTRFPCGLLHGHFSHLGVSGDSVCVEYTMSTQLHVREAQSIGSSYKLFERLQRGI